MPANPAALSGLKAMRMHRGLTIAKLSEHVGVSAQMLCQMENCKNLTSWGTAVELARVLDCSLDELVDRPRFTAEARRTRLLRELALLDRAIAAAGGES